MQRRKYSRYFEPKLTFSKKLAIVIAIVFIGTWIIGWAAWFLTGEVSQVMLDFVNTPFSVVIGGYMAKAGVENYTKIKTQGQEGGNNESRSDG